MGSIRREIAEIDSETGLKEGLEETLNSINEFVNFLQDQIELLTTQLNNARHQAVTVQAALHFTERRPAVIAGDKRAKPDRSYKEMVLDFARDELRTVSRPLDRRQLLENLLDRGFTLEVADPPKFVGKTLWGSKEFIHIVGESGSGYWLSDRDLPPGFYGRDLGA